MSANLRVELLLWEWWVGKRNTDYVNFKRIQEMEKSYPVSLKLSRSLLAGLMGNVEYAMDSLAYKSRIFRGLGFTRPWRVFRRSVVLPQAYLDRIKADVVHTNLYFPVNKIKVPIVIEFDFNVHGIPSEHEELRKTLYVPRWIIERSAVVCVRHEPSLDAFKRLYPEFAHKGVVMPHYHPHLEAVAEEKIYEKFQGLDHQKMRLLYVGNQARFKGLPELVEAYKMVKEEHDDLEFTVVSRFQGGEVPLPPEVKRLSNLPSSEVYRLMADSHIMALPSRREATGNVFWEAMANGCVILGPDMSPQREIFGEFGVVADPTSPEEIAKSLERLLRDREFSLACALKARSTFLEKYHHSIVAKRYYEVYQRAVSVGGSR